MTYDEPKNYTIDAVLTTDGQHYTARMSVHQGSHCWICGRKFHPGNHVAYLPIEDSNNIKVVHNTCLKAWQRPAVIKP
jgi:hypothetical protein